jgi:carbon-monoxide dehydrogenase medium subunit
MYAFDFVRPATVEEAVAALAAEDAQALAGGQTLIPTLRQRLASPSVLVSLGGIAALGSLRLDDGVLAFGAGVTHARIAREAAAPYPALAALAGRIGDPAVRNRGTIGGSLANDDPSADWPAAALASGATIATNAREIAADDYFQGMFTTALDPGEIITEVRFPVPERAAYRKFAQPASRFALVGVFVAKYPDALRVAVTGATESGVFRWAQAEAALATDFRPEALTGLKPAAEGMIGDLHGTPDYRAHLTGILAARAVSAA